MAGTARLKLLGGALLEEEGEPVTGPASHRHSLALLALLTRAPSRTLSRAKLVGFLWPESPEEVARNRLTTTVHRLRSRLGREVLDSVGHDDLRLDTDALPCDACRFEEALEAGALEEAVATYGGPFLDGFHLSGSTAFAHWADRQRDVLARAYAGTLESLAERAVEGGRPEVAAGWWRRRAAEDPMDSRVAARLAETLDAAGNRAAALRAARTHVQRLEEELGTAAPAELGELIARLEEGPEPDAAPAPARDGPAGERAALAVLPFEALGEGPEAREFAEGLHGDLLTKLSAVSGLTVISRTSVLRYREGPPALPVIARQLGVGTVLEGGVQRAGERLRLNVQLIDARRDVHLWAETYDRRLTAADLFDIQSELAERIVGSLKEELTDRERERVRRRPTGSLEAYRLYLRGRALLDRRSEGRMRKAARRFRAALELDPRYAPAWAGLADTLAILAFYAYPPPEGAPDPMEAARRALSLDPELGEAHGSLGILHSLRQEGPAALAALERAVALQPGFAEAHAWLAWARLMAGRPREATAPARRGAALNPMAPAYRAYLAECLLAVGEAEEALEEARRARRLQPRYGLAYYLEGVALHQLGLQEEATAALEAALARVPGDGTPTRAEVRAALAATHAAAGRSEEAASLLDPVRSDDHPFSEGLVQAALGEADAAFEAFGRIEAWDSFANEAARYFFPHALGPLREDARYGDLLERIDRSWGLESGA